MQAEYLYFPLCDLFSMRENVKLIKKDTLEAFKSNDQQVMRSVYQGVFPKFKVHVLKNNGGEEQAKDVFQEAFVACWRNIKAGKLERDSNIEGYLFTIAKNKWIDYLRSASYKKSSSAVELNQLEGDSEESEDHQEQESRYQLVQEALAQIQENCQKIIRLFYFERRSMDEISTAMKLAPASARNQKYRCMEKLRTLSKELQRHG
jgi:RNA polymerase sigma factor (sigma-70 family)